MIRAQSSCYQGSNTFVEPLCAVVVAVEIFAGESEEMVLLEKKEKWGSTTTKAGVEG